METLLPTVVVNQGPAGTGWSLWLIYSWLFKVWKLLELTTIGETYKLNHLYRNLCVGGSEEPVLELYLQKWPTTLYDQNSTTDGRQMMSLNLGRSK